MTTIADVAALAGVGKGTVSRVLNEHPSVTAETRERVQQAMATLEYRPSPIARNLKRGRTQRIGVLVSFFTNPSSVERLRGLSSALAMSPYELVLYPVDHSIQRDTHMESIAGPHQVDGLLLISLPPTDDEVERLQRFEIAVVQVDARHPAFPRVVTDDVEGGHTAAAYLLDLGHRRIGFIGDPEDDAYGFTSSRDRCEGYHRALRQAGVPVDDRLVRTAPHGVEAAAQAARQLLADPARPTAVFAASDTQAFGVMKACRELGLDVPGDVSILGFDDIDAAVHVGLSTVRQPLEDSGRAAARLLLEQLEKQDTNQTSELVLPTTVIPRATTAPPRS